MAGLGARDIRRKIKSINSTKQITKAMELTSTAKLKSSKKRFEASKPYFNTLLSTISDIINSERSLKNTLAAKDEGKAPLVIVVTSYRGLCGGYNVNVLKEALALISRKESYRLITVGKKAKDFFKLRGYQVEKSFEGISEKPDMASATLIGNHAQQLLSEKVVDEVYVVATKMVSTISQVAYVKRVLPVELADLENNASSLGTETREAGLNQEGEKKAKSVINYDPSAEAVLNMLMPKLMVSTVLSALVEAAVAEQAARRNAMESATDNAQEMIDTLVLSYNQARQAAITQEITEIVGGANAL